METNGLDSPLLLKVSGRTRVKTMRQTVRRAILTGVLAIGGLVIVGTPVAKAQTVGGYYRGGYGGYAVRPGYGVNYGPRYGGPWVATGAYRGYGGYGNRFGFVGTGWGYGGYGYGYHRHHHHHRGCGCRY